MQLVGRSAAIEAELASQGVARTRIEVVEAPETGGMGDTPLQAVRTKRKSSIAVGLTLQRDGRSDAFISAGNTGAVMAASTLILRLYPGFERPAIGIPFPTVGKPVLVLDGGANVDCSPQELVGFAHLGVLYARDVMDRSAPAVGLLNIGEEEEKGNAATKEAHRLLAASGLSFVGNIEGRDIVLGSCDRGPFDVVVCDGFVGNVLLKFYESTGKLFHRLVDRELGAELAHGAAMQRIWRVLDYAEYGGAPLLGVRGVSIVCHGRSSPEAQRAAVKVAIEAARHHLVQHMTSEFLPGGAAS
ncbi:MAG: phosphate acyltransferase PlsX [Gemmatimonadetes bacterium RIFCSPLOWO2_12_FULL_68_9]|nr:MAG: phosphate acyltransferase PlsX [Gemmatimonadetes bacterium RIFCSPLOWO2_12_FULL_68_9]